MTDNFISAGDAIDGQFITADDAMGLLKRIAASSGLITREIRLAGKWWQHDQDTFLTFDAENHPLVLSYRSGAYHVGTRALKKKHVSPRSAPSCSPRKPSACIDNCQRKNSRCATSSPSKRSR